MRKLPEIARTFQLLCEWLKKDMPLIQDAKEREERYSGKGKGDSRNNYAMMRNYFGQVNQSAL